MKIAVYGAPGTGKTTWGIDFIVREVEKGADLSDFVVSTFRKPLAADFRARLGEKVGLIPKDNLIATTHAVCNRILGLKQVADANEKVEFCAKHGIPYDSSRDKHREWRWEPINVGESLGNQLFGIYDYCANNFVDLKRGLFEAPIHPIARQSLTVWMVEAFGENWDEWKHEKGLFDFVDMLREVWKSEIVPPNAKFLIEDEFHDKTPLQYEVYRMWAKEIENVCVLGDPLQAIYSFWGTDPKFFESEFVEADEQIILPISYRFGQELWDYAIRIVKREGMEVPEIKCVGETSVRSIHWGEFIHLVKGFDGRECMYLVRANYMAEKITDVLSNVGIPYYGFSGGLRPQSINIYNMFCRIHEKLPEIGLFGVPSSLRLPTSEAEIMLKVFPRGCFSKTKTQIRSEFIESEASHLIPITPMLADTIRKPFVDFKNVSAKQKERLIKLYKNRQGTKVEKLTHTVCTIHASKGRESDIVFLFDDITPLIYRTMNRENEARVFYVGATRAKKTLYVVHGPERELSYPMPMPRITQSRWGEE